MTKIIIRTGRPDPIEVHQALEVKGCQQAYLVDRQGSSVAEIRVGADGYIEVTTSLVVLPIGTPLPAGTKVVPRKPCGCLGKD